MAGSYELQWLRPFGEPNRFASGWQVQFLAEFSAVKGENCFDGGIDAHVLAVH
jgi:hypothetical protein